MVGLGDRDRAQRVAGCGVDPAAVGQELKFGVTPIKLPANKTGMMDQSVNFGPVHCYIRNALFREKLAESSAVSPGGSACAGAFQL